MRILSNARLLLHVKGLRAAVRYVVRHGRIASRACDVLAFGLLVVAPNVFAVLAIARVI